MEFTEASSGAFALRAHVAEGAGLTAPHEAPAPHLSVVILAYDEVDNLEIQVAACLRWFEDLETSGLAAPAGEVVVVDDGSRDGTGALADRLAAADERVRVVHHPSNRGMGATIRSGYGVARGRFVTQLPADCQVGPDMLARLLPQTSTHDLVLSVYAHRDDGAHRSIMSRVFQATVRLLYGRDPRYTGTMMIRRELLDGLPIRADTFFANLEVPFRLLDAGASHAIVEIEASPRRSGHSKVANTRRILRVIGEMCRVRIHHWRSTGDG